VNILGLKCAHELAKLELSELNLPQLNAENFKTADGKDSVRVVPKTGRDSYRGKELEKGRHRF